MQTYPMPERIFNFTLKATYTVALFILYLDISYWRT